MYYTLSFDYVIERQFRCLNVGIGTCTKTTSFNLRAAVNFFKILGGMHQASLGRCAIKLASCLWYRPDKSFPPPHAKNPVRNSAILTAAVCDYSPLYSISVHHRSYLQQQGTNHTCCLACTLSPQQISPSHDRFH